jgi:hypothetical protein
MTSAPETEATVTFEGMGTGTELWGGTQANFLVYRPGHHEKEAAVVLNDPAAAYLAGLLGREDDEAFRAEAARRVGLWWLGRLVSQGRHVDSVVVLSRALLEGEPGLARSLR